MTDFATWLLTEEKINKKLIDQFGQYKVYMVNAKTVRDMSPSFEEFGISSDHYFLSAIPQNEIWIADDISSKEVSAVVSTELYTIASIQRGIAKEAAYKLGLKRQDKYLESRRIAKNHPERINKPADEHIYIKKYGRMPEEKIDVWIVDGKKVRDKYKWDFWAGGHGYVYDFVPNQEIWLEQIPHKTEYIDNLLHEFIERTLMKYKRMDYESAHRIASKVEFLQRERRNLDKERVLGLSKSSSLAMSERFLRH